jgi:predicted short-subunit dehydrogenase-like oxidoreductase (DUF2520 family)
MAVEVGHLAVEDRPDLIDAVGELEAAVLDMDRRLGVALIDPVHIGDA